MFTLQTITLDATDPTDAQAFYEKAFGLTDQISVRQGPGTGTGRPFTISLVVGRPSTVDSLVDSALTAGATSLKPVEKSFWGYGGIVQAPDGSIWKIATSAKKDNGPATREIDDIVLLLGVADVKASKRFYAERGLGVKRGASAASTPSSRPLPVPSSSRSIPCAPWRRRPVSRSTRPPRTESSWAAAARPSPTRTGSPGRLGTMARTIATNTTVDLDGLLEFVRPRHP